MPPTADFLADVPLFALLDEAERQALLERLEVRKLAAGTVLFNDGDPGSSLYVVRSGEVEISFRTTTGDRMVLETAGPGAFFGELSLLDGGARTATATVTKDTEALILDREGLQHFLERNPHAAMDILAATSRRLRENVRLLHGSVARNVNEEVAERPSKLIRAVDWVSAFAGSLGFLVSHLAIFFVWIVLNVGPLGHLRIGGFDPFPFGFLTLCVSLEAIVLSCLLMLSQNRQATRDRVRADVEYAVNLRAELEIAHLHEKFDAMNSTLLQRLESLAQRVK